MLPDGDGIGVLAELRADPSTAEVPVIMVTARSHASDERAAWEAGVVDYLTKPFDGSDLLRRVRDAVTARSEEHTSELQALMRTSYAAFCLNKKTPTAARTRYLNT